MEASDSVTIAKAERQALAIEAMGLFSPSGPVTEQDLFAGRVNQMRDLISVIGQAGQHGIVYGERGVGKTSLAATMVDMLKDSRIAVRINCDGSDTFASVWRKVFEGVTFEQQLQGAGFTAESKSMTGSFASLLPAKDSTVRPNDVRKILTRISRSVRPIVFIDEFDRLRDRKAGALFADTLKTLSDQLVSATVVLVGVADNVDELIAEHLSIERALVQIHMPRMSQEELAEVVNRVRRIGLEADRDARTYITRLSQGLPHYTHSLSQASSVAAIERGSRRITITDVAQAIRHTIKRRAQESVVSAYHKATMSTRETLFRQVLLACALAPGDDLGYFASGDVRGPLSAIMGRAYDIPAFSQHLNELSDPDGHRGPVLQKTGTTRKFRFRFVNPLLQPYVIMRGLNEEMITAEQMRELGVL